ncbi:MAG TPA: c-type cytochrome [Woeseiaceae bacterium]|jgi:cytochrome c553|nr:c-type cytochrome [Woeseiaceae bacterium]
MGKVAAAITFFGALMTFTVGIAFGAQEVYEEHNANLCFDETVKVATGADPESLSTFRCTQALRVELLGRENESAILFNRGIIQRAKGDLVGARASFEKAVRLSRTVDRRNLALAEVARELGDYRVAARHYELVTRSDLVAASEGLRAAVFARLEDADTAYFAGIDATRACVTCHGANGISDNPEIPTLAGRTEDRLEHALHQYMSGARYNALMTSQAQQMSDEEAAVFARYFARLDGPETTSVN